MTPDSSVEMDFARLNELKCVRCGSDKLKKSIIKSRFYQDTRCFEQEMKCKDCGHEMLVQVMI